MTRLMRAKTQEKALDALKRAYGVSPHPARPEGPAARDLKAITTKYARPYEMTLDELMGFVGFTALQRRLAEQVPQPTEEDCTLASVCQEVVSLRSQLLALSVRSAQLESTLALVTRYIVQEEGPATPAFRALVVEMAKRHPTLLT